MKDILGIVFFGVLAGYDEWVDIYDFAVDEVENLKKYLELRNGIPSHDTIQRVFAIIRPDELQDMLMSLLTQMIETTYVRIRREHFITDGIAWFKDCAKWKKLTSIGYEKKCITDKETGEIQEENRYFLCGIRPVAELFTIVIRRHWDIENNPHRVLDVVFKEDSLRSKEKKAIHNFGLIRRFVMFIIILLNAIICRNFFESNRRSRVHTFKFRQM